MKKTILSLCATTFLILNAGNVSAQSVRETYEQLITSAERGNADAQYAAGLYFSVGDNGFPKDDAKAFYWAMKSAEQGNSFGQWVLGILYHKGQGTAQSLEQAVFWYQKSADQDYQRAQESLAAMYQEGWGVTRDWSKAAFWYKKAADQGNEKAKEKLAVLERSIRANGGSNATPSAVPRSDSGAGLASLSQTKPKIPIGSAAAPSSQPIGPTPQNVDEVLAVILTKKQTQKPDEAEKLQNHLKNAMEGDSESQRQVGNMMRERDRREAALWYSLAAAQGNLNAASALCDLGDVDINNLRYCENAASAIESKNCRPSAYMMFFKREGIYVNKNISEADQYQKMMEQCFNKWKSETFSLGKYIYTGEKAVSYKREETLRLLAYLYENKAEGKYGEEYIGSNDYREVVKLKLQAGWGEEQLVGYNKKIDDLDRLLNEKRYRSALREAASNVDRLPVRIKDALRYLNERSAGSSVRLIENFLIFEKISRREGDGAPIGEGTAIAVNAVNPIRWQYDTYAPYGQIVGRTVVIHDRQTYEVFRISCSNSAPCITKRDQSAINKQQQETERFPFNVDDGIINALNQIRDYVVKTYGPWKAIVTTDAWGGQKSIDTDSLVFNRFVLPPEPPRFLSRCQRERNC